MRVSKKHDVRLNEILDAAELLFTQKGYESATVNDILDKVEIGKGTFYHYFKSKEDVMNAVITRNVERVVERAKAIAKDGALAASEKMRRVIQSLSIAGDPEGSIIEELHKPANAQMHQKSIVEIIRASAPVLADVVGQGIREGVYRTPYPLETIEFLLAASQFIFDKGIFRWKPEELSARAAAFVHIMELSLGAVHGSFRFLLSGLMGNSKPVTSDRHEEE
jgi:AcrR family transcriptional regulator